MGNYCFCKLWVLEPFSVNQSQLNTRAASTLPVIWMYVASVERLYRPFFSKCLHYVAKIIIIATQGSFLAVSKIRKQTKDLSI